jgi:uracil-DNA glycosylase
MSLNLDNRQRAMLREMGVRLWQPPAAAVATESPAPDTPPVATDLIAAGARNTSASGTNGINVAINAAAAPAVREVPPAPRSVPTANTEPVDAAFGTATPGWQLGVAQTLYANAASPEAGSAGPLWLVLGETPAASLRKPVFDPFDGDAGKLLGNMLRAAGLHKSGQPGEAGPVMLAPLARLAAGGVNPAALPDELASLIAQTRPDVILVMGRLAAQAVLQSSEPLGKLRGQVHQLHGAKTVVTYDAAVLLRSPLDKAKAWEDLCLAIDVSQQISRGKAES